MRKGVKYIIPFHMPSPPENDLGQRSHNRSLVSRGDLDGVPGEENPQSEVDSLG